MSKFRILSIDGGGIKGVFPAAFLAALEESVGHSIGDYFDLIAGTSTGGIIALGLGLGVAPKDLLRFYEERGPTIFPRDRFGGARQWFLSKYDSRALKEALAEVFGTKTIGDAKRRLLIPSLNASNGEIHIFKTRHHEKLTMDWRVSAAEVALATSAAPTFLPVHESAISIPFVDGGLWANNPVGLAAVEAITLLGQRPEDLRILSIGCTSYPVQLRPGLLTGRAGWATKLVDAIMSGQSGGSLGTAAMIATHENVFRFDPPVQKGRFALDNTAGIYDLKGFGYSVARKAAPRLQQIFFDVPAAAFRPIPLPH